MSSLNQNKSVNVKKQENFILADLSNFSNYNQKQKENFKDISKKHNFLPNESTKNKSEIEVSQLLTPCKTNYEKDSEAESVLLDNEFTKSTFTNEISSKIIKTLNDLSIVNKKIGYDDNQIFLKNQIIIKKIDDILINSLDNVKRKHSTVGNECKWLKQQIQMILIILNDSLGENNLSFLDREIVFANEKKNTNFESLEFFCNTNHKIKSEFSNYSIYNSIKKNENSNFLDDLILNTKNYTLFQMKNKLNIIFFNVLRKFVNQFDKLNDLILNYYELKEIFDSFNFENSQNSILKHLPLKEESLNFKIHLDSFKKMEKKVLSINGAKTLIYKNLCFTDNHSLCSSKKNYSNTQKNNENVNIQKLSNQCKETSSKIIMMIRNLKFNKITQDFFSCLNNEINYYKNILISKKKQLNDFLDELYILIEELDFSEIDFNQIKKNFTHENNYTFVDFKKIKSKNFQTKFEDINSFNISSVKNIINALIIIKSSRKTKINELIESCKILWNKLNISEKYIDDFMNTNSNFSEKTLNNFQVELNQLKVKKIENIDKILSESQNELINLCNQLYLSNDEKKKYNINNFLESVDIYFKERLLEENESKILKLKTEYENKKKILILYEQLNLLIKDWEFLKQSSKDSSRFLIKNSFKILLCEEKIRKKLDKNLPNLLKSIKIEIKNYNLKNNLCETEIFFVDGVNLNEVISNLELEYKDKNAGNELLNQKKKTDLKNLKFSNNNTQNLIHKKVYRSISCFEMKDNVLKKKNIKKIDQNIDLKTNLYSKNKKYEFLKLNNDNEKNYYKNDKKITEFPNKLHCKKRNEKTPESIQKNLFENKDNEIFINQNSNFNSNSYDFNNKFVESKLVQPLQLNFLDVTESVKMNNNLENDSSFNSDAITLIDYDYMKWRSEKIKKLNKK